MGALDGGREGGGGEDEAHPAIIAEAEGAGISAAGGRGERGAMGREGLYHARSPALRQQQTLTIHQEADLSTSIAR
jgi:hypothetical protein